MKHARHSAFFREQSKRGIVVCSECPLHAENEELGDTCEMLFCDYLVDPVFVERDQEVSQEGTSMQASS